MFLAEFISSKCFGREFVKLSLRQGFAIYGITQPLQYHVISYSLGTYCNCRINKGVSKAYKMAMTDFTNTSLTSSCIIFTELLSQDSTKLRVHLSTARRLLQHHNQFTDDSDSIC